MTAICLVGIGKIAVDQHVPSINGSDDWELAATVSRAGTVDGVQAFTDFDQMLSERPDVGVISLCLPPVPRYDYAAKAIAAGRHVMLEKPPGATLAEVYALADMAKAGGVTIFTTWHSRMAEAVAPAKAWLAEKTILRAQITWREDVRKWHPGQDWVFAPGGMGVFDPGSNALSIITEILPMPIHLRSADLLFPSNCDTPIAAQAPAIGGWATPKDPHQAVLCLHLRQEPPRRPVSGANADKGIARPQRVSSRRAKSKAVPRCHESRFRRRV